MDFSFADLRFFVLLFFHNPEICLLFFENLFQDKQGSKVANVGIRGTEEWRNGRKSSIISEWSYPFISFKAYKS